MPSTLHLVDILGLVMLAKYTLNYASLHLVHILGLVMLARVHTKLNIHVMHIIYFKQLI